MKKSIVVLLGLFVSVALYSQEKDEYQTVFGDSKVCVSGMGGFEMQFSSLGGYYAYGAGGGGGIILNRSLLIGGYGTGYSIDRTIILNTEVYNNIGMGHGGFLFGYIHKGNKPVHPAAFLQIGWGELESDHLNNRISDNFLVLNPSLEVEVNVTRYFRIAVGGHYQFVSGINNYPELSNSDFSGPGGKLAFRFGWF
ncbi:MAG: hypothetical protein AB7E36_13035 [Salinivirgaceae bacterium]